MRIWGLLSSPAPVPATGSAHGQERCQAWFPSPWESHPRAPPNSRKGSYLTTRQLSLKASKTILRSFKIALVPWKQNCPPASLNACRCAFSPSDPPHRRRDGPRPVGGAAKQASSSLFPLVGEGAELLSHDAGAGRLGPKAAGMLPSPRSQRREEFSSLGG